jgi:hypothetical protein
MFQYTVCITGFDSLSCRNTLFTFITQTWTMWINSWPLCCTEQSTLNYNSRSHYLYSSTWWDFIQHPYQFPPSFSDHIIYKWILLLPLQSLGRNDYHCNTTATVVVCQDRRSFPHIGSTAPSWVNAHKCHWGCAWVK